MITETRKKLTKKFNTQLKRATGLERDNLLKLVEKYGSTKSGNLSTLSKINIQTLKSIVNTKNSKERIKKVERTLNPSSQRRRKLTERERLDRELKFMERHNLQYTQKYQIGLDILKNSHSTDKQLKAFSKHEKIGSEKYKSLQIESLATKLSDYMYKEYDNPYSEVEKDPAFYDKIQDTLKGGLKNIGSKDEILKRLQEIEKSRQDLVNQMTDNDKVFRFRVDDGDDINELIFGHK